MYKRQDLCYPFLADSMVTSMLLMGTPLATAFVVTGSLMLMLVYAGFCFFAWEITRSRLAVTVGFLLFFFNGGLGFFHVLDGAVSYTHLDVYKRQRPRRSR